MRLLRFFLFFAGIAILVLGPIFFLNKDSFVTVFQNRAALLEGSEWVEKTYSLGGLIQFMAEQPQHSAVISVSNNPDKQAIRYQSSDKIPGGSFHRLILLIAYANQLEEGLIDATMPVEKDRIQAFYLPDLDASVSRRFHRWYNAFDEAPSVDQLVHYLIDSDDPAVSDYLFFLIGSTYLAEITETIGDGKIAPPVPFFGLRRLIIEQFSEVNSSNGHHNFYDDSLFTKATELSRRQWFQPEPVHLPGLPSFQKQREMYRLFPKIQPDKWASILLDIFNEKLISQHVSIRVRDMLLQKADDRLLQPHITMYASHFDEKMGYLAGWTATRTKTDGHIHVQVIILHNLPPGLWFHMNSNFMIRDFHHRLFYDPDTIERSAVLFN